LPHPLPAAAAVPQLPVQVAFPAAPNAAPGPSLAAPADAAAPGPPLVLKARQPVPITPGGRNPLAAGAAGSGGPQPAWPAWAVLSAHLGGGGQPAGPRQPRPAVQVSLQGTRQQRRGACCRAPCTMSCRRGRTSAGPACNGPSLCCQACSVRAGRLWLGLLATDRAFAAKLAVSRQSASLCSHPGVAILVAPKQ
jgi:hypothetical protein